MSDIVLPNEGDQKEEEGEELKYEYTMKDEEEFFLMYNLGWPPSEVRTLDDDYRKWLIARYMHQKQAEKEMMRSMQIANQIGPNLRS
jgi:hypothetical protein